MWLTESRENINDSKFKPAVSSCARGEREESHATNIERGAPANRDLHSVPPPSTWHIVAVTYIQNYRWFAARWWWRFKKNHDTTTVHNTLYVVTDSAAVQQETVVNVTTKDGKSWCVMMLFLNAIFTASACNETKHLFLLVTTRVLHTYSINE